MPRYTKKQLGIITRALVAENFLSAANEVLWWNTMYGKFSYTLRLIMNVPSKNLPLHINDESDIVRIIARERLKLRR